MLEEIYLRDKLLEIYGEYMHLKIYIDTQDEELNKKYNNYIKERKGKMLSDIYHIDAGIDIFTPSSFLMNNLNVNKLDYQIICSAKIIKEHINYNTGFYIYPRSSISKSNLRLANNVGIIDAGYRGHLIGMFDIKIDMEIINKFDRHLQICAPNLIPIIVEIVKSREELGDNTNRGENGLGSTGI